MHPPSIYFTGRLPNRRLRPGISPAHRMVAYRCSLPGLTELGNIRLRRTQPSTPANPGLTPGQWNLKREFDLAKAGCEYRAPLTPRLARANHNRSALKCDCICKSERRGKFQHGGEGGIRTPEASFSSPNRFRGGRFQPDSATSPK